MVALEFGWRICVIGGILIEDSMKYKTEKVVEIRPVTLGVKNFESINVSDFCISDMGDMYFCTDHESIVILRTDGSAKIIHVNNITLFDPIIFRDNIYYLINEGNGNLIAKSDLGINDRCIIQRSSNTHDSGFFDRYSVTSDGFICLSYRPDILKKISCNGEVCWQHVFETGSIHGSEHGGSCISFSDCFDLSDNKTMLPITYNEVNISEYHIINKDGELENVIKTDYWDRDCFRDVYRLKDAAGNVCIFSPCRVNYFDKSEAFLKHAIQPPINFKKELINFESYDPSAIRDQVLNVIIVVDPCGKETYRTVLKYGDISMNAFIDNRYILDRYSGIITDIRNGTQIYLTGDTGCRNYVTGPFYSNGMYFQVIKENKIWMLKCLTIECGYLWEMKLTGEVKRLEIVGEYLYVATSSKMGIYRIIKN